MKIYFPWKLSPEKKKLEKSEIRRIRFINFFKVASQFNVHYPGCKIQVKKRACGCVHSLVLIEEWCFLKSSAIRKIRRAKDDGSSESENHTWVQPCWLTGDQWDHKTDLIFSSIVDQKLITALTLHKHTTAVEHDLHLWGSVVFSIITFILWSFVFRMQSQGKDQSKFRPKQILQNGGDDNVSATILYSLGDLWTTVENTPQEGWPFTNFWDVINIWLTEVAYSLPNIRTTDDQFKTGSKKQAKWITIQRPRKNHIFGVGCCVDIIIQLKIMEDVNSLCSMISKTIDKSVSQKRISWRQIYRIIS